MRILIATFTILCAAALSAAQDLQSEYRLLAEKYVAAMQAPPAPLLRSANPLRVPLESKAIKGAPYSAQIEIESIQTLADGNRIVHRTTGRVYRDSAGRTRREEDRPTGPPTILLFDPEAGASYSLDVEQRIAWKTMTPSLEIFKIVAAAREAAVAAGAAESDAEKLDALKRKMAEAQKLVKAAEAPKIVQPVEPKRRADEERRKADVAAAAGGGGGRGRGGAIARGGFANISEETEEGLGTRTMEGVRATGIRRTTTIPAGAIGNELPIKIVSEEWTSPDLQVLVQTSHSDPRIGQSSYRVINISRTEPNPTLFQVPSDFTVKETGIRQRR